MISHKIFILNRQKNLIHLDTLVRERHCLPLFDDDYKQQ